MESNISNEVLLDSIKELTAKIDRVLKEKSPKSLYQSELTNELNTSLSSAFNEYPEISFNKKDGYYANEYADLNRIMVKMRPILSKYGLSVTNRTILSESGETILETRIWHASGQWIESRARFIPSKNDAQTYASAMLHLTRMQVCAILNITVRDNPDDDNAIKQMASAREIIARASLGPSYDPKKESYSPITKEQIEELEIALEGMSEFRNEILDAYRIQSLADLPKSKYRAAITRIREIKTAMGKS